MRKRTKVLIAAVGLVGAMVLLIVTVLVVAINSDWGHVRVRDFIESTVRARLAEGTKFRIGSLNHPGGTTWVAESISLFGEDGRPVASIRRATLDISIPAVLRGDVRLGRLVVEGAHLYVEQARDRSWNTNHLFAKRLEVPASPGPKRRVVADSLEIRDSRIDISQLDTLATLPPIRRSIDKVALSAGRTILVDADGSGDVRFSRLTAVIDNPPATLVSAQGGVHWWGDSLKIDVPRLRLPGSRASVTGTIGWPTEGTHLALDVVADSVAVADIRWMSALIPSEGDVAARVAVRTHRPGVISYEIQQFDLKGLNSHLNGSFAITPGNRTEVRDLRMAMTPMDLALVRNVFGDTILKAAWQGSLDGTLTMRGGFLDSLMIDSVNATYTDARIAGAKSRVMVAGAMDVATKTTELIEMRVRIDSMNIRTVGAVLKAADSLRGALKGSVVLDGPTRDLGFHDLRLRHVDGTKVPTVVSGSGRIASNPSGHWMDANLTIDTLAIASLPQDSIALPLKGLISGTLVLGATADTMTIDARLSAGGATTRLTGTTLLDSLRTHLALDGTIAGLDVREFVGRKDIPSHNLSGALRVEVEQDARNAEQHLEIRLDSTSRVADSRIQSATLRFGRDSAGVHLDTAAVRADTWRVDARGTLAAKGLNATDSITFSTEIDSLGALRMILLDTAGKPLFEALDGRANAGTGVLKGSFERLALTADVGASQVVIGATSVNQATGNLSISGLPDSASGFFRGRLSGIANGNVVIDTAQLRADMFGGKRARVAGTFVKGDSVDLSLGADVTWPDSTYSVHIDSLTAKLGHHRWQLRGASNARVDRDGITIDSLILASDSAATITAHGRVPNRGEMNAKIIVHGLGFDELAFLGFVPAEVSGTIGVDARFEGTRDAPRMTLNAKLTDIKTEETERPSLQFDGTYANKKASLTLLAIEGGVTVLNATGDLPIDLTLRETKERILDAPISIKLHADSVGLKTFEGLFPKITGLDGKLTANVEVGGTFQRPRGNGTLELRDGKFMVERYGFVATAANAQLTLAGDSVIVKSLRMADGQSALDTVGISGAIRLAGRRWAEWGVNLRSTASNFRVIEDHRSAMAHASWNLDIVGDLAEPRVSGNVTIPYAEYTIGAQRRPRAPQFTADTTTLAPRVDGIPSVNGVVVTLGNDVRLKSKDANVQLTGGVELFGTMDDPWISGTVSASRGTYRVRVGPITRTFRVDSGTVIVEGTKEIPAGLNIWTSYLVRSSTEDVTIGAHVYGTTDAPRIDLSSNRGSATSQSEIISYLVFGKSNFGLEDASGTSNQLNTATKAFLPTLGGWLEATLGTVMPFFSSFQVTSTTDAADFKGLTSNPMGALGGLLNSYALTGGRQLGSDTFLSLTAGRCGAGNGAANGANQLWYGAAADYRPKRALGASFSIDPGPAPCTRLATGGDNYQFGLDLSYDWKFGKKR